jgi:hypothetical protein
MKCAECVFWTGACGRGHVNRTANSEACGEFQPRNQDDDIKAQFQKYKEMQQENWDYLAPEPVKEPKTRARERWERRIKQLNGSPEHMALLRRMKADYARFGIEFKHPLLDKENKKP